MDEHTEKERQDLELMAAYVSGSYPLLASSHPCYSAHEQSEVGESEEEDAVPDISTLARERSNGLDEDGMPISESLGLARAHRTDEEWRRYEELTTAGFNPVAPGGTFGPDEEDETVTPVHDSYIAAQDM